MKTIISFSKLTVIAIFVVITVLATSCKKETDKKNTGDSSITFKLDGVEQNYTQSSGFEPGTFLIYKVEGSLTSDTTVNYINVSIYNDGPIDLNKDYSTPGWLFQINFNDAASVSYINPRDQISTVRFTEVSSTRMKGTFSGVVKNGAVTKTITEGVFDVAKAN